MEVVYALSFAGLPAPACMPYPRGSPPSAGRELDGHQLPTHSICRHFATCATDRCYGDVLPPALLPRHWRNFSAPGNSGTPGPSPAWDPAPLGHRSASTNGQAPSLQGSSRSGRVGHGACAATRGGSGRGPATAGAAAASSRHHCRKLQALWTGKACPHTRLLLLRLGPGCQ
jgi:hypothetical protein